MSVPEIKKPGSIVLPGKVIGTGLCKRKSPDFNVTQFKKIINQKNEALSNLLIFYF